MNLPVRQQRFENLANARRNPMRLHTWVVRDVMKGTRFVARPRFRSACPQLSFRWRGPFAKHHHPSWVCRPSFASMQLCSLASIRSCVLSLGSQVRCDRDLCSSSAVFSFAVTFSKLCASAVSRALRSRTARGASSAINRSKSRSNSSFVFIRCMFVSPVIVCARIV